jgi:hypothetical protein
MTKILYVVTCVVCLITFTGLSNAQTVSIPKIEGEAGSTVEASIDIDTNVENVGSIKVTLIYKAELLTAKEVTSIIAGFAIAPNLNEPGKAVIGGFSSDGQGKTIAAGPMFKVKFEVNADAQGGSVSDLTLEEVVLKDVDVKVIPVEVKNGEFTVLENIPPEAVIAGDAEITVKVENDRIRWLGFRG